MVTTGLANLGEFELFYELSGPKGAPVVCLHHCFASDHHYFDAQMGALSDYQVLRFDARGHGGSGQPQGPYSLELMADDLNALRTHLNIESFSLCGVSLGGQVAQTFTLRFPEAVDRLILVNTTCQYNEHEVAAWRGRANRALGGGMTALQTELLKRWFTEDAAKKRIPGYVYMEQIVKSFHPHSFAWAAEAMCMLNTRKRLQEIVSPTLIVASHDDPGAPPELTQSMAESISDCQLEWLEPAKHLSSLEHPERFNELLVQFLRA